MDNRLEGIKIIFILVVCSLVGLYCSMHNVMVIICIDCGKFVEAALQPCAQFSFLLKK